MDQGEGQKLGRRREPTGELIGSYALIAQIASGEATTVHLAQKHGALGFHRLAAIKRLKPEFLARREWVDLLLDEARLSSGVHHANIVDVIDVGNEVGCYLVMDYVEGADLDALLSRAGKERHARYVLPPIVDALHGLHAVHTAVDEEGRSLAMVHQAPRSRHILLGIDGTARLTDFSQVLANGLAPSTLRQSRLKGAYMAPEQVRGDAVDARSDLFILGIALWEALTGERLFQAESHEASKRAVLERHIPRPSDVGYRPPRALDRVCLRALARDPDQRYLDAEEMGRALRDTALNEALYATSSEVGQWVRALAGRALIERRRAIGADAPSLEMAIDAFENGQGIGVGAVEIANVPTAVTPAPSEGEIPGSPSVVASVTLSASGPLDRAAPTSPRNDGTAPAADRSPMPGEPSRVTRLYTVAVAAPPSPGRASPSFPSPAMTLLGVSDGDRTRPVDSTLPTGAAAPLRGADASSRDETPAAAKGPSHPAAPPADPSVYGWSAPPPSARGNASLPPQKPEQARARDAAPRPGAYRHLAADRRAAATLPERAGFGEPKPADHQLPHEVVQRPHPFSAWPGDVHATSQELGPPAPPSQADGLIMRRERPANPAAPRLDWPDARYGAADDGSLKPPRAAHMDLPDSDEEPESSSGLGFIAILSLSIIALAGFVGYRQWSAEQAVDRASTQGLDATEAAPLESGERPTGERPLEPTPGIATTTALGEPAAAPPTLGDAGERTAREATPGASAPQAGQAAPEPTAAEAVPAKPTPHAAPSATRPQPGGAAPVRRPAAPPPRAMVPPRGAFPPPAAPAAAPSRSGPAALPDNPY